MSGGKKSLGEMAGEELGRLFPIILSEHDPRWKDCYLAERDVIENAVGAQNIARVSHIGSTAVPGLLAKPTIDILLEIKTETDIKALTSAMEGAGYIYTKQAQNPAPHMAFYKGYTPTGFAGQAFHVHVRYPGDWDEPYFRDYLIAHPSAAAEYGELKRGLQKRFEHDRDGYTHAKTDFIKRITAMAREEHERDI